MQLLRKILSTVAVSFCNRKLARYVLCYACVVIDLTAAQPLAVYVHNIIIKITMGHANGRTMATPL